ncbi:M15 family metallopeptidase [Ekhidna sp.]|jgi:peptidoglycan L-alanyl-D-glutamate endopeptidase CwlK|uniref:M15 family metallopeptidase n=1 Tax=Ekhidna sp. TaxID=2608089 RepID=UPI0032EF2130
MKLTKKQYWIVGGVVVAVLFFAFRKRIRLYMGVVWDPWTEKRLWTLHPAIRKDARAFINEAERLGIKLRITSAMRSDDEQAELYAKGRTASGSIVTYARPGQSLHNYGLAIDVVEIKEGKGLWVNSRWETIGQIGKRFGFKWGGDWNNPDRPHFYKNFGKNTAQLMALKKASGGDYVNIT